MKSTTKTETTATRTQESVSNSAAQVGVGIIGLLSALIGIWATACLIGGLSQYGVIGMIRGWMAAVFG
ncbi:MAG: hypothetical protein BM485_04030 [Desulfobulbaceae bacterium DB1]|nr:MAG: hypothetical protein BM485_04030 [Desulfobulbaceae bacterium DB1]